MIKVFRGNWRGIGKKEKQFGLIFDFQFREIIHQFNGARLHVFMAIALHSNEEGFSWPSYDTLERETGYTRATIATALNELHNLTIDGHRVLEWYRERDSTGKFTGSNRYLVFPTQEELDNIQSLVFPTLGKSNGGKTKPEVKPKTKGKSKPVNKVRDARLDHPAIVAYREIVHLQVPTSWRQDVVDTVSNIEKWRGIVKDWEGKGFKKGNVKDMLDVYCNGWRDYRNGHSPHPANQPPAADPTTDPAYQQKLAALRLAAKNARPMMTPDDPEYY